MKIWKLTPIDRNHRNWTRSKYGREAKEIIVRAESENKAREFVSSRLCIAVSTTPGDELPVSPWNQPALVAAAEVEDSNYPKAGPEEILDPGEARAYNDA